MSLPTSSLRALKPTFSQSEFRQALGMFATGVTIVTACASDGTLVGLTASSFNSVSLAPPLVLWSLAQSAGSMAAFSQGSHYAIHILSSEQQDLARQFSTKNVDRFADVGFSLGASGAPIIKGALATFECFNRSQYQEGDHVIFVGEVERCTHHHSGSPLLYHGGKFFAEHPL